MAKAYNRWVQRGNPDIMICKIWTSGSNIDGNRIISLWLSSPFKHFKVQMDIEEAKALRDELNNRLTNMKER